MVKVVNTNPFVPQPQVYGTLQDAAENTHFCFQSSTMVAPNKGQGEWFQICCDVYILRSVVVQWTFALVILVNLK